MFRFEYDRIIAHHPYRTSQPWDLGGIRLLHVDGVNGLQEDAEHTRHLIGALERRLAEEWAQAQGIDTDRPGAYGRFMDNHYGYTVVREADVMGGLYQIYQLRFSDGSLYVWLMPNTPMTLATSIARNGKYKVGDRVVWDRDKGPEPCTVVDLSGRDRTVEVQTALNVRYWVVEEKLAPADPLKQADWTCSGCGQPVVHTVDCPVWAAERAGR